MRYLARAALIAMVAMIRPGRSSAQALPPLGAAGSPGAAALGLLQLEAPSLDLTNPARAATSSGRTFVSWQSSAGRATDLEENVLGAGWSSDRLAGVLKLTTRSMANLFDDSTLAASGLGVRDLEFEIAGAADLLPWLAVGITTRWVGSEVLGTTGSGHGSRAGLILHSGRFRFGWSTGAEVVGERWSDSFGDGYSTPAIPRTSTELALDLVTLGSSQLAVAIGHDQEAASGPTTAWKGGFSMGVFNDHLRFLGGFHRSSRDRGQDFSEVGLRVTVGEFAIVGGLRSGEEPAPGRRLVFGLAYSRAANLR